MFGENLTTEGIHVTDALVGERWRVGSAVRDRRLAARMLAAPELPAAWRHRAEQQTRTDARRRAV
jgi:hypothetical protein